MVGDYDNKYILHFDLEENNNKESKNTRCKHKLHGGGWRNGNRKLRGGSGCMRMR